MFGEIAPRMQGVAAPYLYEGGVVISVSSYANEVAVVPLTINAIGPTPQGIRINVSNNATDGIDIFGVTGTIGPAIGFALDSTFKGFIGVASKAGEGIAALAAGDMFIRTQGGGLFLNTNSGVQSQFAISSAGRVVINPTAAGTGIGLQILPLGSAEVGLSVLDPGANATELRIQTNNAQAIIQAGGTTPRLDLFIGASTKLAITATTMTIVNATTFSSTISCVNAPLGAGFIVASTFTATLVGCTTSPTGTINYRIVNQATVTLEFDSTLTGTSNATTCSISGMPAAIQPARAQSFFLAIENNGATAMAVATIQTTGSILFSATLLGTGSSGFTAAGIKGIPAAFTTTYNLN